MAYPLTILSVFRNSMNHLGRYVRQLEQVLAHFEAAHVIWIDAGSADQTAPRLKELAHRLPARVTLVTCHAPEMSWSSINHHQHWRQLEWAWNAALAHLEASEFCVCVESDLIWDDQALLTCIKDLDHVEVVAPMLFKGSRFYDTHGFRRHGQQFTSTAPYVPDWDGQTRLVACETVSGLVVTRYPALRRALWRDDCLLRFPDPICSYVDTAVHIQHP